MSAPIRDILVPCVLGDHVAAALTHDDPVRCLDALGALFDSTPEAYRRALFMLVAGLLASAFAAIEADDPLCTCGEGRVQ